MIDANQSSFENLTFISANTIQIFKFSDITNQADNNLNRILASAFIKSLKTSIFYSVHDTQIFDKLSELFDGKVELDQLARLFVARAENVSDLMAVLFEIQTVLLDDEVLNGVGFFFLENPNPYLSFNKQDSIVALELNQGVPLGKFEKGCIIFNTESEHGFKVLATDDSEKPSSKQWKEQILGLKRRKDNFYMTQQVLQVCREFVEQVIEVPSQEMSLIKSKAKDYFLENQTFEKEDFENKVFEKPEVIEAFDTFTKNLQTEKNISLVPEFEIEQKAVSKEKKYFRSVIKLDKNFHIYVHSQPERIEKGFDTLRGLNYYKLYFNSEEAK